MQRYHIRFDEDRDCYVIEICGEQVLFDTDSLPLVSSYRWKVKRSGDDGSPYAQNGYGTKLHRLIMGLTSRTTWVDHINHDTLDNRKQNLRIVTREQNMANRRPWGRYSRFKGVSRDKYVWRVQVMCNKKCVLRRTSKDEIEAALIYDAYAKAFQGEYAVLNYRDESIIPVMYKEFARELSKEAAEKAASDSAHRA